MCGHMEFIGLNTLENCANADLGWDDQVIKEAAVTYGLRGDSVDISGHVFPYEHTGGHLDFTFID